VTPSIRIGRIAGIEVGVNWSWLVVFALLAWSLADGVFPDQNPGLSRGAYVGMAIVATVLFFASLLAHELGHALVARREGMEIDGITLWLFGGVARFKGMFPSAGAELRIALAGPAVSLAIGVVCVAVAWALGLPEQVDGVLAWLGYVNLVLLVFNLLPALPLDGGRVLRALLWKGRGDFAWATGVAASVGRGFGYVLIAAGLFLFIFQGAFGGAWLAFIGWFLLQAAGAEARFVAAREALGGLRVRDLMTRDPVTVPVDSTIGDFMDEVAWSHRHTTYPVLEGDRVLGLLSFRCVAAVPRSEWDEQTVRGCMLPADEVAELREDEPAVDALGELAERGTGRAVVVEDGRLVGMLSRSDLARALQVGPRRRRRAR
jgi:Zn-dependent protease/predicted transcriptional regulator